MSQEGKGYNFGQDYVTRAETLVHFYLHRREQAKPQCVRVLVSSGTSVPHQQKEGVGVAAVKELPAEPH